MVGVSHHDLGNGRSPRTATDNRYFTTVKHYLAVSYWLLAVSFFNPTLYVVDAGLLHVKLEFLDNVANLLLQTLRLLVLDV